MKKTYSSKFKSKVALEATQGESTINDIAGKYQIHPNQVQQWKMKLLESAVLCADPDSDIAKFSVLHGNEQFFASKYMLCLPQSGGTAGGNRSAEADFSGTAFR